MITVLTENGSHIVKPTIFSDKTSQVWKLPEEILSSKEFQIIWHFEEEREIIDLYSLNALLPTKALIKLHMPYLPYGRQDKGIGNDKTFNLSVLAHMINELKFDLVTTIDAHNPVAFYQWFRNSINAPPTNAIYDVIKQFNPTFFVYPDKGALNRYKESFFNVTQPNTHIYFEKVRDQLTGNITGLTMHTDTLFYKRDRLLIVDDICDGGATFIGVAKELRKVVPDVKIALYVTHGIFSRGRQHLLDNGIDEIYTTNSILSNTEGYKV